MPKPSGPTYTITFVGIVAVIASLLLSSTSEGLRAQKELNVELDKKRNILLSFGIEVPASAGKAEIDELYAPISSIVVDHNGVEVPDADVTMVDTKKAIDDQRKARLGGESESCTYCVHRLMDGDKVVAYSLPILGVGLWSKLFGYVALDADAQTVRGITFYAQAETPGLGAEIVAPWFQNNFKGRKLYDESGKFRSVTVVKGKAADQFEGAELLHYVDGISGATITCRGVNELLEDYFKAYQPYFERMKTGGS